MKKVIVALIVILVLAIGGFIFYKTQTNNKQENKENTTQLAENAVNETANKVENAVENKVENEVENTIVEDKEEPTTSTKPEEPKVSENTVENEDPFLRDFDNYNPGSNEIKITESKAKEIAQIGFDESKKRIAGEGADDVDSQKIVLQDVSPNNYFTRKNREYDKKYTNIIRKAYAVTRTNDMGNGITIYVDATTGLIIGGRAFGD